MVDGRNNVEGRLVAKWAAIIGSAAGGVTILSALVGVVWYVAGLEARMRQLETQVHTLTVAPLIKQGGDQVPAPNGAGHTSYVQSLDYSAPIDYSQPIIPNAVANACGKLADTLADQVKSTVSKTALEATRDALKLLGCLPTPQTGWFDTGTSGYVSAPEPSRPKSN